jgi:hypothetical protein
MARPLPIALLVLSFACPVILVATAPEWWNNGVTSGQPANDFSAVNQGQVKNLAIKAQAEFIAKFGASGLGDTSPPSEIKPQGGVGWRMQQLIANINAHADSNNYSAANLGQVKAAAEPFWTRLFELGLATDYPWSGSNSNDFTLANVGQAKNAFSFSIPNTLTDSDGDGIPDIIEGQQGTNPNSADSDGDGLTDSEEIAAHCNPWIKDNPAVGLWVFGYTTP